MTGRIVRCNAWTTDGKQCIRVTRMIGGNDADAESWTCLQQDCPKQPTARREFGQPKQKGKK